MKTYHIKHSHEPIAKKRHRAGRWGSYDPQHKEKINAKIECMEQCRSQGLLTPLKSPISVFMTAHCPIPKSWSKKKKRDALQSHVHIPSRKDIDNVQKFYFDVMNEIVFHDDSQIVTVFAQKIYSDKPCVDVYITSLEDDMITEHALTIKEKITMQDLDYLVKKANRLGMASRQIVRVYQEEDAEGCHVYYVVDTMIEEKKDV